MDLLLLILMENKSIAHVKLYAKKSLDRTKVRQYIHRFSGVFVNVCKFVLIVIPDIYLKIKVWRVGYDFLVRWINLWAIFCMDAGLNQAFKYININSVHRQNNIKSSHQLFHWWLFNHKLKVTWATYIHLHAVICMRSVCST